MGADVFAGVTVAAGACQLFSGPFVRVCGSCYFWRVYGYVESFRCSSFFVLVYVGRFGLSS